MTKSLVRSERIKGCQDFSILDSLGCEYILLMRLKFFSHPPSEGREFRIPAPIDCNDAALKLHRSRVACLCAVGDIFNGPCGFQDPFPYRQRGWRWLLVTRAFDVSRQRESDRSLLSCKRRWRTFFLLLLFTVCKSSFVSSFFFSTRERARENRRVNIFRFFINNGRKQKDFRQCTLDRPYTRLWN